jgi:hypothetical protein
VIQDSYSGATVYARTRDRSCVDNPIKRDRSCVDKSANPQGCSRPSHNGIRLVLMIFPPEQDYPEGSQSEDEQD